jgi:hypothetical protein
LHGLGDWIVNESGLILTHYHESSGAVDYSLFTG